MKYLIAFAALFPAVVLADPPIKDLEKQLQAATKAQLVRHAMKTHHRLHLTLDALQEIIDSGAEVGAAVQSVDAMHPEPGFRHSARRCNDVRRDISFCRDEHSFGTESLEVGHGGHSSFGQEKAYQWTGVPDKTAKDLYESQPIWTLLHNDLRNTQQPCQRGPGSIGVRNDH